MYYKNHMYAISFRSDQVEFCNPIIHDTVKNNIIIKDLLIFNPIFHNKLKISIFDMNFDNSDKFF